MSTTLHFDLKYHLAPLRPEGRLSLLTCLMLHANVRNRCWPSMDTLVELTGWGSEALTKAKEWLIESGAIRLVPYDKRMDEELDLPQRQHIYELTGRFTYTNEQGKVVSAPYLYTQIEISTTEISTTEISTTETKVFKSSKDSKSKKLYPPARVEGDGSSEESEETPKIKRVRDDRFEAIFEGIAIHCFNTTKAGGWMIEESNGQGGTRKRKGGSRIGDISWWIWETFAGANRATVDAFVRWYEEKNEQALPRDLKKFQEYFVSFHEHMTRRAQPTGRVAPPPPEPKPVDPVKAAEAAQKMKEMRDAKRRQSTSN